jgi:cytochrome c553
MKPFFMIGLFASAALLSAPAMAAGDVAAGKQKSAACAMCHGPTGGGTSVGPKLAGEDPARFEQAMKDFVSGKRDNAMMKAQAATLSSADVANLAAYYASLK